MEAYYVRTNPTENFFNRVYLWMASALALTAGTSYLIVDTKLFYQILSNPYIFFGLFILQLGIVIALGAMIEKLNYSTAILMFFAYAATTGITLSPIAKVYTGQSIAITFLTSALTFAVMAFYGYFTKKDLSALGNILTMALIGIIISLLINLYFKSEMADLITSGIGVLVFTALIAYDTQKLKNFAMMSGADDETFNKYSVIGALMLYLDLINLFLFLLRFMGKKKEN